MQTIKIDIYQRVTDAIVAQIESGAGTYRMPWNVRADRGFSPVSVGSGKPYRGINTVVLWSQAQAKAYSSSLWGTYNQWAALGAQVRCGEHGSPVVYWGTFETRSTDNDSEDSAARRLFAKGYTVFNAEQVDGLKLPARFEPKLSKCERIERAEGFFRPLAEVKDGGNRAFYRPDVPAAVWMPGFDQFPEREQYYSVLAHETTHWTGHESRCARDLKGRFGDASYAAEELIAELGAAYTMANLELETTPRADHAQYITSWLKVLKNDKRAIFTAASQAQKAADWMQARVSLAREIAA